MFTWKIRENTSIGDYWSQDLIVGWISARVTETMIWYLAGLDNKKKLLTRLKE